jgi:amino acid adenylation domain-containing protein
MRTDDIAYIIFTSGSTGAPKGVMISLASVRHYLSTIVAWLGLTSGDRALETCELSFDFSVHNMFSIWEAGASLHILPATRVMNAVKFARSSELTVWNSVPSLAGMLLQVKALPQDSLAGLRLAVFGGEQLPLGVVEAFQQAAPHCTIANLYGPTEATVFCTAQRVEKSLPLPASRDVVAIGSPLPGNKVRIVDEKGDEVTPGASGELLIGGVQLAAGYLGQTELTAQRFPIINEERWYRSGDLALQDKDGRYHCLGRIDNQVKVLGYRVELEEIDAHLRRVVGAALVGSVAWPVLDGMARGIVSFVGAISVEAEAIKQELVQHIPSYMIPHRIIALKHMPP